MKKIDATAYLKQLIVEKEALLKVERIILKDHFHKTYESFKPVNLITNGFKKMISSPEKKSELLNSALGLTTGMIAKKMYSGNSHNPLVKLSGVILEMVVASKVTKNADEIKIIGEIILKKLVGKFSNSAKP